MAELWVPESDGGFRRAEYAYDFLEHPLNRRRSFHGHDPDHFGREFGVLVHEHCEEVLGAPECSHYYGLPVDGYEAIRRFSILWGQPGSLGLRVAPMHGVARARLHSQVKLMTIQPSGPECIRSYISGARE